ncbi:MtN3_slv domain-containing protein [Cephalotus follicularis]|uniref:Bidirectional sugar transporter SWEET n=1 Tax=Cephalotus follicularis TaxID=3775 RepID=A0A1Q3BPE9_CEPFO|nr:MtN3_slv domain-containing protein [Cephalotus follicularis]
MLLLFFLGNITSFLVFLAPVPTFYTIYKRKSAEGFQSIPYVVALSSAMLLIYYGFLKTNAYLIISINAFGIAIELTYLMLYMIYASRKQKCFTMKLLLLLNIGAYGLIFVLTFSLLKGSNRVNAVGWICAVYNVAVFAAPLSIMRRVIKTKSVEYMPVTLSMFLISCATMWFFYGFLVNDYFIALPNVLGLLFGIAQIILYFMYKDGSNKDVELEKEMQKMEEATTDNENKEKIKAIP